MSLTIVALPSIDEPVYKVSSEKVPHLTILFLGEEHEPGDVKQILDYTEHATSLIYQFGLSVDRRGLLGEHDADVLFFEKQFAKRIADYRGSLLKNDTIKKYYDATPQYPEWTPHLTLGYPESPANEVDDDNRHALGWINFDRIAVWTGDYEGPEFLIKDTFSESEVSMSDKLGDFLAHHGVKGMKWGRRKADGNSAVGRQSADYKKATSLAGRKPSTLSNKQLKALNERKRLELEYAKLNPSKTAAGRKFLTDAITGAAKTTLQNMLAAQMKIGAEFVLQQAMERAKK